MILEIYSVYDRVSGVYGNPFLSHNANTAIRQFNYMMSKAEMVASDCDLYFIGHFDSETGIIKLPDAGKPFFVLRYAPEVKANESI